MIIDLPPCERCKKPRAECDCVPDLTVSPDGQIVTIFGIRYDIELFRHIGVGPLGSCIEIVNREDGTVTLRRVELPAPPAAVLSAAARVENELNDDDYVHEFASDLRTLIAHARRT